MFPENYIFKRQQMTEYSKDCVFRRQLMTVYLKDCVCKCLLTACLNV